MDKRGWVIMALIVGMVAVSGGSEMSTSTITDYAYDNPTTTTSIVIETTTSIDARTIRAANITKYAWVIEHSDEGCVLYDIGGGFYSIGCEKELQPIIKSKSEGINVTFVKDAKDTTKYNGAIIYLGKPELNKGIEIGEHSTSIISTPLTVDNVVCTDQDDLGEATDNAGYYWIGDSVANARYRGVIAFNISSCAGYTNISFANMSVYHYVIGGDVFDTLIDVIPCPAGLPTAATYEVAANASAICNLDTSTATSTNDKYWPCTITTQLQQQCAASATYICFRLYWSSADIATVDDDSAIDRVVFEDAAVGQEPTIVYVETATTTVPATYCNNYTGTGNWSLTGSITCTNQNFVIDNSLLVNNWTLTLVNSTINATISILGSGGKIIGDSLSFLRLI